MAIIKPNNNTISAITALPAAITTGKVLQVVTHTNTYSQSTTSTSYSDIQSSSGVTWEPTITPTDSTSVILVIPSINIFNAQAGSNTSQEKRYSLHCDVKVGSGSYSGFLNQDWLGNYNYEGATKTYMNQSTFVTNTKQYDHNTTSQLTFRWQWKLHSSGNEVGLNGDGKESSITFMEIAT
jgi:hypothetical protein